MRKYITNRNMLAIVISAVEEAAKNFDIYAKKETADPNPALTKGITPTYDVTQAYNTEFSKKRRTIKSKFDTLLSSLDELDDFITQASAIIDEIDPYETERYITFDDKGNPKRATKKEYEKATDPNAPTYEMLIKG